MKWSLPLVELSRVAARCASPLFAGTTIFTVAVLPLIAGCSMLPVMHNAATDVAMAGDGLRSDDYSDAERKRLSELPAIPDFDVMPGAKADVASTVAVAAAAKDSPPPSVVTDEPKAAATAAVEKTAVSEEAAVTEKAVVTEKVNAAVAAAEKVPVAEKADGVPLPVDSKIAADHSAEKATDDVANAAPVERIAANNPTPEKASIKAETTSRDVADLENKKVERPATTPSATTEKSPSANVASAIPGAGKMAAVVPQQKPVKVPMLRIDAPKPFGWAPVGKTTGNRSFQIVSVGDEGYRTLVVGSVAGNDPLAIELVEQMARHLHDGKAIFGGFQATIIRTLNPDGEALGKLFNENGQYINHGFPKDNGVADGDQPTEVTFLLEQIRTLKPQRIIHIRSIDGNKGVIATTVGSQTVANDAADWLGFRVIKLPDVAVSGSLERHLGISKSCEVLTFALPATSKKKELWDRYGDALQNLLMGDDAAAREMARQPQQQSSANLSNADEK